MRKLISSRNIGLLRLTFVVAMVAFLGFSPMAHATIANFTINGGTSGSFTIGEGWTINLASDAPNTSFTMCGTQNGVQSCTPNWGVTDSGGNWSARSAFDTSTVGSWTEWVQFPDGSESNRTTFTVSPAAPVCSAQPVVNSLTVNGGTNITAYVGQTLSYQWSSSNGTSFVWSGHDENGSPIQVCDSSNPGGSYCDVAAGTTNFGPLGANAAGHTYTITFSASAQACSTAQRSVIVHVVAPTANLTINGATWGNFTVGQAWNLHVASNIANTSFNMCAVHPNGVQDCTPASQLTGSWSGSTDGSGNWTMSSSFPSSTIGNWTEWAQFPDGTTSNHITFTVSQPALSASFTINDGTSGNYTVGQNWTLNMTSNQPNAAINLCAIHPNGVRDCTMATQLNLTASTNANGGWTGYGTFPASSVGSWTEWVCFGSITSCDSGSAPTSNQVSFTVSQPVPTTVSVSISPSPLAFAMQQGNLSSLTPSGASVFFTVSPDQTVSWTTQTSDSWIVVSPSGTARTTGTASVGIGPAAASLAPGTHTGSITFSPAAGSSPSFSPVTVYVTLMVNAAPGGGGPTTPTSCTLSASDFENDLTNGQIVVSSITPNAANGTASFVLTNNTQCTAPVSLSSYKVFVSPPNTGWLATQQLFNVTSSSAVAPNSTQTFTVNTASCMTQVDAWYGQAPTTLLDSNPYGYPNVPFVFAAAFTNSGNLCGAPSPSTDLSVTKTVSSSTPVNGAAVDYRVTVNASGNATSTGVVATDTWPSSGLTFVSATPSQGTYASSTGVWTIGIMAPTSTATLDIMATVHGNPGDQITNSVSVGSASTSTDPNTGNNNASVTIGVASSTVATTTVSAAAYLGGIEDNPGITSEHNGDFNDVMFRFMGANPVSLISQNGALSALTPSLVNESGTIYWDNPSGDGPHMNIGYCVLGNGNCPSIGGPYTNVQYLSAPNGAGVNNVVLNTTGSVTATLLGKITASSGVDSLGWYDVANPSVKHVIFAGSAATGTVVTFTPSSVFALYTNNGGSGTFSSNDADNVGDSVAQQHFALFGYSPVATSTPSADLSMTKTVDHQAPKTGDTITYTLTVSALGPATSTGVVATDTWPSSGLTFVSSTPSEGTYASSTGVWTIGDMAPSSTATLNIMATVTASAGASVTNSATAGESSSSADPNAANNTATSTIVVASNGGGGGSLNITPAQLPNGTTTVPYATTTLIVSGGTFAQYTWEILSGSSPPGLELASSTVATTSIEGTPTATGTFPFAIEVGNNGMTVSQSYAITIAAPPVSVISSTDLSVTKTVSSSTPVNGAAVDYRVTVNASGNATSTGVVATDTWPSSGLTFVSATPSQGTYASSTGVWTIGIMAPTSTATLDIMATVHGNPGDQITNFRICRFSIDFHRSEHRQQQCNVNDHGGKPIRQCSRYEGGGQ